MIKAKRAAGPRADRPGHRGRVPRDRPVAARAAGPPLLVGRPGPAEAIAYWREAGRRSQARSGHAEAVGHFTRGLEQVAPAPRVARSRRGRAGLPGRPVGLAGRLPGLRRRPTWRRSTPGPAGLAERIGDSATLFRIVWGMWALRLLRDEMDTAIDLAGQLLALAESRGDRGQILEAWFSIAITRFYRGEFRGGPRRLRPLRRAGGARTLPGQRPDISQDTGMTYRCYRALADLVHGPARRRLAADQRGGRVRPGGRPPVQPGLRPAPRRLGLVPLPAGRRRHPLRRRVPGDLGRAGVPVLEGPGDR